MKKIPETRTKSGFEEKPELQNKTGSPPKKERIVQAGDFLEWLQAIRKAQISHEAMDVACGDCRACCTSSYFIHIKPDETQTLAKIPKILLFPAPGLPKGHVLLGYSYKGHCPMLVRNECSIYEFRPQTCRDFDCRVFPATGLSESDERPLITRQAKRWRFHFSSEPDKKHMVALKQTAAFLTSHSAFFPAGFVPRNPPQQAILAVKVYPVFLEEMNASFDEGSHTQIQRIAGELVAALDRFEKGQPG